MKKSKLIRLLSSLNHKEIKSFEKFICSPYFNTDTSLIRLFQYLKKQFPLFPDEKISMEVIFQKVFPERPFDKKELGYLMSNLIRLAEQFLGLENLKKKEALFEFQVMEELVERKLDKNYTYLFKKTKKKLAPHYGKDGNSLFFHYLSSKIAFLHAGTKEARTYDKNLQNASDALDDFYILEKLKYICEMLNRQAILADTFSISFMENILETLAGQPDQKPLISIYLQIYSSLLHPDKDQYLEELLRLIKEHSSLIAPSELNDITLFSINLSLRKIRAGKGEYIPITLDLYIDGIENKSLFVNNYLTHWSYNNIVKLALRDRRFGWIEDFIYKYNATLQTNFRENALNYNLAELYFHKKDYESVLTYLSKVRIEDLHYGLGTRILLIKTFYESEEMDAMLSNISSFKAYLGRNKHLSASLKKSCQNYCNLLFKAVATKKPKKRIQLSQTIQSIQPLAERSWLLKVAKEQDKVFAKYR